MSFSNLHHLLNQVLLAAAPHLNAGAVEEQIPIRVSDESLEKLATHVAEGLRVYTHHPVVGPWMRTLPDDLFASHDEELRRRHGVYRVELGDIHDGVHRSRRVGYVALAHSGERAALVLFVAYSASKVDIETPQGAKNSWAELIVGSWEWAWEARHLRFLRDDRMSRSNAVWVRINDAVKERPGARYYLADIEIDPHRDGWFAIITGQKSSEEVEVGKVRRLAGQLTKLTSGAWPRGHVPVGLRLGRVEDVRGRPRPDKSAGLEADPDQADEMTAVLTQYAAGVSKARITVEQARRGTRNRRDGLLLPQIVPLLGDEARVEVRDELSSLVADGSITDVERRRVEDALEIPSNPTERATATSVCITYVDRILAGRRHLRTGVLDVMSFGAIAGRTDYHGWRPTFVTAAPGSRRRDQTISEDDLGTNHPYWTLTEEGQRRAQTHGFWHTPLHTGTPVRIDIDDAVWGAIESRMRRGREDLERRTATGLRRPLSGLKWETDEGTYVIGQGGERASYRISAPDGRHLYTLNAAHAARALGELLLNLAERVDTAPLPLHQPPADTGETRSKAVRGRIDVLEKELKQINKQAKGLLRDRADSTHGSRKHRWLGEQIDDLDKRADDVEHIQLPALRAKLEGADRDQTAAITEEISADFAHLTVVGLALLRCDPLGPAPVRDAVTWLLDHGRGLSNLRTGEHKRQVLLDARVRVPLADGTIGWLDAGTLDLTDRRLSSTRKTETVDDLARRLLRDGTTLDDLAERYGWPASDILVVAADWLAAQTNLNPYLRAAVVTAAAAGGTLPVGPVVYAHATNQPGLVEDVRADVGNWIVTQIQQSYLATGATWAKNSGWLRNPLDVPRTAMVSISQDGPTRRQSLIASVDGLRNDEQLKELLHPGRRSFWQPPLKLHDGWITAHLCQRPACPGRGAPMTGFLPVPELILTGDAIYCRYCWRTLTSGEELPDPYRRLWDVRTDTSALRRTDGIPTIAAPPTAPARAVTMLRTRDIAEKLGIPIHQVHGLVNDKLIPASRNAGGKLVFDADRALSASVRARFSAPTRQHTTHNLERLTIQHAAAHLQTTATIVRLLSRSAALANVGGSGAALYDRSDLDQLLAEIRRQTRRVSATFADLATPTELATTWEVTPSMVRRLVSRDVLNAVTVGTLVLIDRASIDQLDDRQRRALDRQVRLTVDEVAAQAGLSPTTVLHHRATGALKAVQLTPDGRVWFLPDDVGDWLASRGGSKA